MNYLPAEPKVHNDKAKETDEHQRAECPGDRPWRHRHRSAVGWLRHLDPLEPQRRRRRGRLLRMPASSSSAFSSVTEPSSA